MTSPDVPPTRRARRAAGESSTAVGMLESPTGPVSSTADAGAAAAGAVGSVDSGTAGTSSTAVALGWLEPASLVRPGAHLAFESATTPYVPVDADLLARAPRRSPWRPGVIVPTLLIGLLIAAYCAMTLLWPLHALPPTVTATSVKATAAPAAKVAWPAKGSAAVSVQGIGGSVASTPDARAIASITKVVTALVVLDQMPLQPGEQGPLFHFTAGDSAQYWSYLRQNESALDVPVGGTLSEYQLLEGMLIGSAGNYADRLAGNLWPTDAAYANAAQTWLQAHGVSGITIVEPTGIEAGNTASPAALLTLAQKAMANPVIAGIVGKKAVDLPGAGHVVNTNGLLADAGVVGIKTGSLDAFNLLAAKDVKVGATTVRMYAATLGQPDEKTRLAATRSLFAQLEKELQLRPSVAAGTIVGDVTTRWGTKVPLKTSTDADVVLWNGGAATTTTSFSLGEHRDKGDVVGSLTAAGPLDTAQVDVVLARDVDGPDPWWRLTHPLDLFGLNG